MSPSNEAVTPEQKKEVFEITNALVGRRHKYGGEYEWWKALFFSALEKYKDWRKALRAADLAMAKVPEMPPEANAASVSPQAAESITGQFPPEFFEGGPGAE